MSKGVAIYARNLEKPHIDIKKDALSVLLDHKNGILRGKVFSNDLKSSYLGYDIEIASIRIPLKIDGLFYLRNPPRKYGIRIYENDELRELDEKSPVCVDGERMSVPFLKGEFNIGSDIDLRELMDQYSNLLNEIDYLNEYSLINEYDVQKYIETLLEIAQRDKIALNQAKIYMDYLESIVEKAKGDLKYSMLLENVVKKIEMAKSKNLFDIGDIGDDLENMDLNELKDIHASLIERYVSLNRNDVIANCFFNLKLEGIYTNNEKLADELIEKAHAALNLNDFEALFDMVNALFELDEREDNR